MDGERATVTVHCPRCGRSSLLAVAPRDLGYAVDVETVGCACDLTEDEYEELTHRAVGAYEAGEREG